VVAGTQFDNMRRMLAIADQGDAPCEHVVSTLQARLDQVRATIAELSSLETHLGALLDHAHTAGPIEEAGVCWILKATWPIPGPQPKRPSRCERIQIGWTAPPGLLVGT
jgi:hypothetical protein